MENDRRRKNNERSGKKEGAKRLCCSRVFVVLSFSQHFFDVLAPERWLKLSATIQTGLPCEKDATKFE
jgi:hypothetical protein